MPSFLLQKTYNNLLDLIADLELESVLPSELFLANKLKTSRTTVRNTIQALQENSLIIKSNRKHIVSRKPKADDYFNISNLPSSKEEEFERFFLDKIANDELLPGNKFSELELSKSSNCTTITVREFLIKFSHTGLIEKKPRSQWQMVQFDEDFANELVSFRKVLEMTSIKALLNKPENDPVWKILSELLDEHKTLLSNIDKKYREFPLLDSKLHKIIQGCSSNRFIKQFFETVTYVCHYHYQWDKSDELERNKVAVIEHIDLIEKLLSRDNERSILSLERHLNTAKNTLMKSVYGLSVSADI